MAIAITLWLLFATSMVPHGSRAGEVHGTLTARGARGGVQLASRGTGLKLPSDPVSEAVVYIERIPPRLEEKLAKDAKAARIAQGFGTFMPSTLYIAAGTTVEFENQDRVYHNAFSVSPTRRLDIGKYAPRDTRRVKFTRPGLVQLFCDIHPGETGFIIVTPNHAYARPDASGAFSLPNLPPGKYTVTVWHPRRKKIRREILVPRWGDVNLSLQM